MLGVVLARLAGVMGGMRRMAVRRMSVVGGLLVVVALVMLGGLAVVPGGVLVVFGCGVVMLDDLFLGHRDLRGGRRQHSRRVLLRQSDHRMSASVDG